MTGLIPVGRKLELISDLPLPYIIDRGFASTQYDLSINGLMERLKGTLKFYTLQMGAIQASEDL